MIWRFVSFRLIEIAYFAIKMYKLLEVSFTTLLIHILHFLYSINSTSINILLLALIYFFIYFHKSVTHPLLLPYSISYPIFISYFNFTCLLYISIFVKGFMRNKSIIDNIIIYIISYIIICYIVPFLKHF